MYLVVLDNEGMGYIWGNLGWMLSIDFLPIFLAYLGAREPIYLMFMFAGMYTVLKVFEMVFIPATPFHYSVLLESFSCLRLTETFLVLKSY